jgi:hypothetical protein
MVPLRTAAVMAKVTVEAFLAGSRATTIRRPIAPAIRSTAAAMAAAGATAAAVGVTVVAEVMAAAVAAAIESQRVE